MAAGKKYVNIVLADGSGTATVGLDDINQIYPAPSGGGTYIETMSRSGLKKTYHSSEEIEVISNNIGTGLNLIPLNTQREDFVYTGTAQAGANTTIQLEDLGLADDALNGYYVLIIDGVGRGQARQITDYTGETSTCTVATWASNPDNTSAYGIVRNHKVIQGLAQAGGATSIQLEANLSLANDALNGKYVMIFAGTGAGQVRLISDYVGATDTCTVSEAWDTNPDAGSGYIIVDTPILASPVKVAILDDTNMKAGFDFGNSALNIVNYNGEISRMKDYVSAIQP